MTHHHNHARKHTRQNADTKKKLATEDSGNDLQPAAHYNHHHHRQHRDLHSHPETHTANESAADKDEPAPIAHHDIDRRNVEVVQTVTTYVATEYDLLIESGTSTLGEFTVSTLPAVITVPNFGVITVPANAGSVVTGAFQSPVETAPPPPPPPAAPAAVTGATAMVASANRQVPLVSSKSETSQPPATQSIASDSSAASSDVDTAVATTAAAETTTSISPASTTSSVSTTSISNSNPTSASNSDTNPTSVSNSNSNPDTSAISSMTSSSGSSPTTSGDASASTLFSPTDPASSASSSSGSSTLSADSTASSGGGGIPGLATSSSSSSSTSPTSTAGAASSGSSGGTNETPKIVGGVVGGVLGVLALLVFAFLFLRWKRKRASAAGVERTFGRDGVLGDTQNFSPRAPESSWRRSSNTPVAAGAFLRGRQPSNPGSSNDNATGERGFQKISGRKIQSVLHTGGDGYGDEIEEEPIPENPFEPGSPVSPVRSFHSDSHHPAPLVRLDSGDGAMMRPSPARTPTTTASSVDLMGSSPPWQLGVAALRPDSVGRSLPRQDGSRNSRFTEKI